MKAVKSVKTNQIIKMTVGKRILREIWEWVVIFVTAFVLVMFLNTAIFATTQVRQTSMQDTLVEGQHLFVEKLSYLLSDPKNGDIVVFIESEYPTNYLDRIKIFLRDVSEIFKPVEEKTNKRLVKRVIGIPEDEVDIRDGQVYLNGKLLEEPYAKGQTFLRDMTFPVTVPPEKYLVFGDNREVSRDSRSFGFIERSQMEGKAIFRFWPIDKFGGLK